MPELFKIPGVEIFSVGKWNGDEYTQEDLNEMVVAFEENKEGYKPYLKLGHDPDQKLLQKDGLPAAGIVDRLYIKGGKLLADFADIPKTIYDLIQNKAYRKVSCEIFWNLEVNDKTYKKLLSAVALLGADTPGVMNLKDILACYKKFEGKYEHLKTYNETELVFSSTIIEGGTMPQKSEAEIKLELELEAKKEEAKKYAQEKEALETAQAAKDAELKELKEYKAQKEIETKKLAAEKADAEKKAFVTQLKADKLCTPGMEPLVLELLGDDKKEYSIKTKEGESEIEKKYSKHDLLKETLSLFKAAKEVNFEEGSKEGKNSSSDSKEKDMEEKVQKYMQEHKCSYGAAAKAVLEQQPKKGK